MIEPCKRKESRRLSFFIVAEWPPSANEPPSAACRKSMQRAAPMKKKG